MNFGGSVSNYKWELVGINDNTNEKIAFPCSPISIGTIVNHIVKEDAQGLWEIPDEVKGGLENILTDGTLTLGQISKIAKVDKEMLSRYLDEEIFELKLPSHSVLMLMDLIRNLSSE